MNLPLVINTDRLAEIETEAALLWAVCQQPERFNDISILEPDDFVERRHGALYGDMVESLGYGRPLSNQLLIEMMERYEVNGEPMHRYLARMTIGQLPPSLVDTARHLRELSHLRKARKAAKRLLEDVEHREEPLSVILDRHTSSLAKLVNYSASMVEPYRYEEHTDRMIAMAQGLDENLKPIPFGIESLDEVVTGMLPGDYVAVAAPSGMGKSAFGGEIALNLALQGLGVLYVTAEMTGEQLAARNTSSLIHRNLNGFQVPYNSILAGRLPNQSLEVAVREAWAHRQSLPIQTIGPRGDIKVDEVARRAHAFQAELQLMGRRLGLIVIDHIGLMAGQSPRESIYERVTSISSGLAGLARSMQVPIMVLAQVVKGVEKRNDGRGRAGADDIRDSNAIRQDANIILTLHRPRQAIEDKVMSNYVDGDMRRNRALDVRVSTMALDRGSPGYRAVAATLEGDQRAEFDECLEQWTRLHNALEISVEKNRNGPRAYAGATIDIECNRIW